MSAKSTPLSQAIVVVRKELRDWSRDRRSIITVIVSSLLAPGLIFFLFNNMANRQRQVEDVTVPVVGAANAPAFVDWLRQQAGVTISEGPANPEEAVRTRLEDVIVVIPENFAKNSGASKPAQIRLVADSSSQNARPKVQRVRGLLQRYNGEIASLRLVARGISPAVATAVQIEDIDGRRRGRVGVLCRLLRLARLVVDAPRDRLQQLARVLEIAAPEDRGTLAGQAVGGIGGHLVIAGHDALRRRIAAFRAPVRRAALAVFLPVDERRGAAGQGGAGGILRMHAY